MSYGETEHQKGNGFQREGFRQQALLEAMLRSGLIVGSGLDPY